MCDNVLIVKNSYKTLIGYQVISLTSISCEIVRQVLGYLLPRNMSIKTKINFNTKHLTKGDPLPPYNGKLRLYNMRFCPFAQRAALALIAKNIDFEVVNIDLIDKPEWLASKSALTKVPALEISDGMSIYESLVVVEYLDDVYPQRRLIPQEPVTKAFDKILVEVCTPLIHSLFFKLVKTPESVTDDDVAGYFKALDMLQRQLQLRGTKFLDGSEPGYADYMIWPWFERLPAVNDKMKELDETKYKVLLEYIANMWEDPVVKEYAVPKEIFQNFQKAYTLGNKPDYDVLLEE
ncbi:unnamed protein product [Arctia plantaginis]|uniref:Uncharacterized protein n=1 Tax=Arctia plantaginis TaxID=874455 RepID=A0A8S0YLU1_ARCPL|nr:unnamed protein product [Arctia plantaginis]